MMMMVMFWKTNVGSSRSHPISSCSSYVSNGEPHGRLWSSNPNLSKLMRSLTSLHLFQTVVGDNRWGDAWHYIGSKTENHFHQNSKIHWSYEVAGVARPIFLVGVPTSKGFQAVPGVGMNTFNCQTGKSEVSDNRRNSAD